MLNVKAHEEFIASCEKYLADNGWKRFDKNRWTVPSQFGIHSGDVYLVFDAVEFQMQYDLELKRRP